MRIRIFCSAVLALSMTVAGSTAVHAQAVSGQGTWETTLQARDVGNTGTTNAFYDTALGVTWLRDANVNGQMDWNTAMSWASNLTVGGVGGWRLPTMADPIAVDNCTVNGTNCGFNVYPTSSEMANLFFSTLGNKSYFDISANPQTGYGVTNAGTFQNMQSISYWLGTEVVYQPNNAWVFMTDVGLQSATTEKSTLYASAMAVHPGDVGTVVSAVPEPETYAMLLAGLGFIGVVTRRRRSIGTSGDIPCQS